MGKIDYVIPEGNGLVSKGTALTTSLWNGDGFKFTLYTDTAKIPCKVHNDEDVVRHGQTGEPLGIFVQGGFGKRNKAIIEEANL